MLTPSPVSKQVCEVCDQDWSDHAKLGVQRVQKWKLAYQDEHGYGFDIKYPDWVYDSATITIMDCITVLKNRNQGPVGPVGMAGPPGPAGLSGR